MHCAETIYWAHDKPFHTQGEALAYARDNRLQKEEQIKEKEAAEKEKKELAGKRVREIEERNRERAASREAWRRWCRLQAVRLGTGINRLQPSFGTCCLQNVISWLALIAATVVAIVLSLNMLSLFFEVKNTGTWRYDGHKVFFIFDNPLSIRWWLARSTLSDEAAKALAQHNVPLVLNGLTTLSDEAAKSLVKHEGDLSLDGLAALPDNLAKALAQHKGDLSLNGLTMLSDEVAKVLSQTKGDLSLNGLTTLSDKAARSLAQHEGCLSLNGLATLSDEAAKALAQHRWSLSLDGLTSLTHAQAIALAEHDHGLRLDRPYPFEGDYFDIQCGRLGGLSLNGLTTLSDEATKVLSQHKGRLILRGLTALSNEQATALTQHKGGLFLNGLINISSEAIKALRANPNIQLPAQFYR